MDVPYMYTYSMNDHSGLHSNNCNYGLSHAVENLTEIQDQIVESCRQ